MMVLRFFSFRLRVSELAAAAAAAAAANAALLLLLAAELFSVDVDDEDAEEATRLRRLLVALFEAPCSRPVGPNCGSGGAGGIPVKIIIVSFFIFLKIFFYYANLKRPIII